MGRGWVIRSIFIYTSSFTYLVELYSCEEEKGAGSGRGEKKKLLPTIKNNERREKRSRVELYDCFTANELLTYESLGLTAEGTAEKFIWDGDNTYGGRVVTNPSGGLLSKGHPLGATGLAQCTELVWQLRGDAGPRQVPGARHGLQHNLGLGGACVVTLYSAD